MRLNELQSNIWKYAMLLITHKRMFVAMLGAYYLTIPNVTEKSIGIILLAGQLAGVVLEVPSGYISDKIGHKKALVLSKIFMVFSTAAFLFAENMWLLVIASVLMGFGSAFLSGTGVAFMHETLRGLGKQENYAQIMGKVRAIGFAVPVIFTVAIPFLVTVSYKLPFAVCLGLDLIGLAFVLTLVVPPVDQEQIDEVSTTNFWQVLREGRRIGFLPFVALTGFLLGTVYGVSTFRPVYQVVLGVPVIYYGVFFGIGRIFSSLMLANSGRIKKYVRMKAFYAFQIVLHATLLLVLAVFSNWVVVVVTFIIINSFHHGLGEVENTIHLHIIKTSKFKATLLSLRSLLVMLFGGLFGFGFGLVVDSYSYEVGFMIAVAVLVILTVPIYWYIVKRSVPGKTV